MKEGLFLLRCTYKASGFKEVATKEEWFVVKGVFGERYTYKDLKFFLVEAACDERCTYQGIMFKR